MEKRICADTGEDKADALFRTIALVSQRKIMRSRCDGTLMAA